MLPMGGCLLKQAGHPRGTFLLSWRIPWISVLWGLAGAAAAVSIDKYMGLV